MCFQLEAVARPAAAGKAKARPRGAIVRDDFSTPEEVYALNEQRTSLAKKMGKCGWPLLQAHQAPQVKLAEEEFPRLTYSLRLSLPGTR